MLKIGSIVGNKYKILYKIGSGGMSTVYLAINEQVNKQWAIKEIKKEDISNKTNGKDSKVEIKRHGLEIEMKLLKKLKHKNLPSIVDIIEDDDSILIVMDYIEGINLKEELKQHGVPSQDKVIFWGKQLCEVLGYP